MKLRITTTIITLSVLFVLVLWSTGHGAQAKTPFATLTVTNTDDSGPGSLRQAITDAAAGDTINFNLANCPCTITLTSGELIIDKSLTIQGPGAEQLSVSGNNNSRVFNVFGDEVTLDALSVIQGNGEGGFGGRGGGIIHQLNGTLTVSNCVLSNNLVRLDLPGVFGGGIHNEGGTVNIVASKITNNRSYRGSGVYQNGGTMNINDSVISANSSRGDFGGGVYNTATLKISRSSISNNIGYDYGGGIYNAGVLRLTQTTVSLNKLELSSFTGAGGGIYNTGNALLINSTISSNNAPPRNVLGGGIYNTATLTLINSTITANRGGAGSGIRCFSSCVAANTIIAGNFFSSGQSPNNVGGSVHSLGNNLFGTGSSPQITGDLTTTLLNLDARLGPLADNGGPTLTHALLPDSPAINAGSNALAVDENNQPLTTDQRDTGYARRIGNTVDIGAVESNVAPTIAASTVSLAAGSTTNNVSLALVNDVDTAADALSVTVTPLSGSGVSLSGISIASDGNVTATATTACNATEASFTLRVTDTGSLFAETTLTVTVNPNTLPTLTYPSNPGTVYGTAFTVNPTSGPSDDVAVTGINLQSIMPSNPGGITVNSSGVVSVASTVPAGSYTVTIRISDACGDKDVSFPLLVANAPLTVAVNNAWRNQGTANPPLSGSLTGLKNGDNITASYSTTGTTSSAAGTYPITATLNDPNNRLSNYTVTNTPGTLTVLASCSAAISPTSLPSGKSGQSYNAPLSVVALLSNVAGPYTFTHVAGQLPPGVPLVHNNGAYALSGTPTTAGTYTFTLLATRNAGGCSRAVPYTVTIAP